MSEATQPATPWARTGGSMIADADAKPLQPAFMARRRHNVLARTVVEEIVPRLLLSQRATAAEAGGDAARLADVEELVRIVLQPTFDIDSPRLQAISGGLPGTEAIYLDLLTPAARRLGVMWEEDVCDFVQVTVGLMRLQQILTTYSIPFERNPGNSKHAPRVLLVPSPGDQHTFGMSMVASFFQRAGWNGWTGVPPSLDDLLDRVRCEWFAVIGFSAATLARVESLSSVIRAVRRVSLNREVGIMVGGPVFVANPDLVIAVGADATAVDGRQAVLKARRLLNLIPTRGR